MEKKTDNMPNIANPAEQTVQEQDDMNAAFVEEISLQLEQLLEVGLLKNAEEFTHMIGEKPALLQELLDGAEVLDVIGKQLLQLRMEEARAEGVKARRRRNQGVPAPVKASFAQPGVDPSRFTEQEMKAIARKLERGEKVYLG